MKHETLYLYNPEKNVKCGKNGWGFIVQLEIATKVTLKRYNLHQ